MTNDFFYLNSLDRYISNRRSVCLVLSLPCFIDIPVFNANSVDRDQTPRSDLGLHCLQMSLVWDARHKWFKHRWTMCIDLFGDYVETDGRYVRPCFS